MHRIVESSPTLLPNCYRSLRNAYKSQVRQPCELKKHSPLNSNHFSRIIPIISVSVLHRVPDKSNRTRGRCHNTRKSGPDETDTILVDNFTRNKGGGQTVSKRERETERESEKACMCVCVCGNSSWSGVLCWNNLSFESLYRGNGRIDVKSSSDLRRRLAEPAPPNSAAKFSGTVPDRANSSTRVCCGG